MKPRPFLIGLTGNIATGKSQVARVLGGLGAHVIDADQIAHQVMEPGGPVFQAVVEAFGPEVLDSGGAINRARLGALVFRDLAALRRLEAIVHPAVLAEVDRRIDEAPAPVVVIEAIKLIEVGMHRACDELWVVTAPRPLQVARLVETRGLSAEEAALRIDAQPPQEEKAALADRVLVNDGDLAALEGKVRAAWAEVQSRSPSGRGRRLRPPSSAGGRHMSLKSWISRHPRLTAWAALAIGMVAILLWAARDVGLLPGQWAALIVATILLAGLCVWIIGWDSEDEEEKGD